MTLILIRRAVIWRNMRAPKAATINAGSETIRSNEVFDERLSDCVNEKII